MMFIHDVKVDTKDDHILRNISQEPSTSSKYDYVLDALTIMLGSWKFEYNSLMTNHDGSWCKIWYQRQSNAPKLQSGTINLLQAWLCSWLVSIHVRELKIGIQLKNNILCWFMMSNLIPKMTQSSKTPDRNHQCPPGMPVLLMYFYLC